MKNSSYYIAPVGDWTHDLPHTVATNMVKVSHALNHSATEAGKTDMIGLSLQIIVKSLIKAQKDMELYCMPPCRWK